MTKKEMIDLNKVYGSNYMVAYEIEGDFDRIERLAMFSTIIDYLRRNDLMEIKKNQYRIIDKLLTINANIETLLRRQQ